MKFDGNDRTLRTKIQKLKQKLVSSKSDTSSTQTIQDLQNQLRAKDVSLKEALTELRDLKGRFEQSLRVKEELKMGLKEREGRISEALVRLNLIKSGEGVD
jgi:chromosome segregation ATPase